MAAREDWARITRGVQEAFTDLIGAVGGRTSGEKREATKAPKHPARELGRSRQH